MKGTASTHNKMADRAKLVMNRLITVWMAPERDITN
jgi:hypothetical protein